ncbi:MAG: hypothetical protein R3F11_19880 [Verrucomicrobiales bacterium]
MVELTEPPKPSPQEEPDPFDPEASREPDLRLLAELIEVPASAAAALLDQHPPDAEKLSLDCYLAAAALIESGRQTLRHAATCELSVNRARARSGTEVIYPIESPPEISPKITGPVEAANQLITEVTPTAFETRLTGVTLEAMMGWRQGDQLSASIAFERVRLAGKTEFGQNQSQIEQPLFYTQSCATAVGLQVGKAAHPQPAPRVAEGPGARAGIAGESRAALRSRGGGKMIRPMKLPNQIPIATAAALCLTALPLRAADDPDADAELGAFRVEYIEADLAVGTGC